MRERTTATAGWKGNRVSCGPASPCRGRLPEKDKENGVRSNSEGRLSGKMLPALAAALCLALLCTGASAAGEVSGWRGDGTGRYGDARPVLEWGGETNVVWKTPMPNWSNASPVITGDRIFVCAEPNLLISVDLADGGILWQRENDYNVLAPDEETRERYREERKRGIEIAAELASLRGRLRTSEGKLKKNPTQDDWKTRVAAMKEKQAQLNQELKSLDVPPLPKAHQTNGYTSATPVTDGAFVYAVFATGIVVCYDMEGDLQWARRLENPPHSYGFCSSPLLVGDVLLVHINHLWGLDAATGAVRWKVKVGWGWGTAAHAEVGGDDVVFTAKGNIVRVADGKLHPQVVGGLDYNGPVLDGGVLYYIQGNAKAYRLPESFQGDGKLSQVCEGDIERDRYYGSPLIHKGLVYAITQANVFSVLDQKSGETVYSRKLNLGKGTVYPSITLGGKHVFISHDNGTTIVIEPGRQYKEVAKNKLEAFRSSPVFIGERMYVRTLKHLYCIGK